MRHSEEWERQRTEADNLFDYYNNALNSSYYGRKIKQQQKNKQLWKTKQISKWLALLLPKLDFDHKCSLCHAKNLINTISVSSFCRSWFISTY